MKRLLLCSAAALALAACGQNSGTTSGDDASSPAATDAASTASNKADTEQAGKAELGAWGVDLSAMDDSVKPGDDFFRYVNGKWLDSFEIPADYSSYGAFTKLFERSEERTRKIIEEAAAKHAAKGSIEQKIGDFYAAYLDTDAINAAGLEPAQADLDRIAGLKTLDDVAAAMSSPGLPVDTPMGGYVDVDSKQPDQYTVYITQSGLGLPDRDYYLGDDFADKREAYLAYIGKILTLAGYDDADARAQKIFDLETEMAKVSWAREDRRDRDKTYHLKTMAELKAFAPGYPWEAAAKAAEIPQGQDFVVREDTAIQALAKVFKATPVDTWKDYLTFHYLSNMAGVLPAGFDEAHFEFYGKTLSGTPQQRERWKRGVASVNGALGEAIGQVYVKEYFPPASKAKMEKLVANLRQGYHDRIEASTWMSDETKAQALDKLAKFTPKIGYPDKWKDYSTLEVVAGDALGNDKRANKWDYERDIKKLGQPIDKTEWFMTPQTVNAYYSPNRNEIVFPAAILQPPFFDPNADMAVNYGGIGAVIGHEMGHGFDDQGRKSDGDGRLRDWWTEADAARFEKLAAGVGEQYAKFSPVEGMHVNPERTMGENLGDLAGLSIAYYAYHQALNGETPPVLDGFTGDQRFFLAWGQVWRTKYRTEELKRRLVTDPHSPAMYRADGIVRNMTPWYTAFDVGPDDSMYLPPEKRVQVW